MTDSHISIGQVKRDISELINRVAYAGERIVLTSRGKPKAAIVSMEDYRRLERETAGARLARWEAWLEANKTLAGEILVRRGGEPLDVDALWSATREELEARDAACPGD